MRVTTKGEYGLRALVELASHEEGLLPSATIAARQKIPENYLSQLLLTLRKGGLVESVRGPAGGHMLARPADQINLGEALDVLEGPFMPMECVTPGYDECCMVDGCSIRGVWRDLKVATDEILYSTTLADLLPERSQPADLYFI
ncbi:MAG: Rrf2 family transcriptional regulator [Anaerolineales bacterium]|nr:Rrf2 family transcriptional regulator [Anaerolineales bacterium]MCB9171350.1 Rrf2 family transcriptional regulator [Ardenticatenales bacterium]